MSAPQFIPGPWRAVRIADPQTNQPYCTLYQTWVDVQSESGVTICGLWANQGARMADANLIAAAPDMYAALEALLSLVLASGAVPPLPEIKNASAALAKARGEGGAR